MALTEQLYNELRSHILHSEALEASGLLQEAAERLVVAAAAFGPEGAIGPQSMDTRNMYAALCTHAGNSYRRMRDYAHAAYMYQEAADALVDEGDSKQRAELAANTVACVRLTGRDPAVRLNLLLAKYEHLERQYIAANRWMEAARARMQIARVYQRRERFEEAAKNYQMAIDAYSEAEISLERNMEIAECHHRLAGILDVRLKNPEAARTAYLVAIEIYRLNEPLVYGTQQARELCELAVDAMDETSDEADN